MQHDDVVKALINVCRKLKYNLDELGRYWTATFIANVEMAGFQYINHGGSRLCLLHVASQRLFKVDRYADAEIDSDNVTEWECYHGRLLDCDKKYFAKPIALHYNGRILETTRARGIIADRYRGRYFSNAKQITAQLKSRYCICDMNPENYFIWGKRVTIVDYAF